MARTGRHPLAALIPLLAFLAVLVPLGAGTAHAESNGGVKVMPLGDSITDGFNVPGGYRVGLWQKLTAGRYKVDFVGSLFNGPAGLGDHDHEGHSGWTIQQIDDNVVNWLRTQNPHTILLHIGTNDIYGSDPAGAPARLSKLIDHITAQAPNAELFVATITPLGFMDSTVRAYNAAIPGIVRSKADAGKRVHLVDMYSALTPADLADGVHPNAGGYDKMADVWWRGLLSVPGSIGTPSPATPSSGSLSSATAGSTAYGNGSAARAA
ncbi:SGNH/GDSL hydrolase family protein [Streptomyces malaysiensis]|uniref:G-D-S-L family lipolytic protein n=1 Tax=Streptomyces malaysiensis TaxID=92644 RepID=A0A7X5X065_STRMQ|nr:SGNH/GDSL hydrolase family protein [Streptomyces malaysiensis]NIY63056.1 G-D-S-L family lipolytic protein [Streptomyces malaysiensis]